MFELDIPNFTACLDNASQRDQRSSHKLWKVLKREAYFEDVSITRHRLRVVRKIRAFFQSWIKTCIDALKLSQKRAARMVGDVFIYGSCYFGVHDPDDDIDILCVGPYWINRHTFFGSFFNFLKRQPPVQRCRVFQGSKFKTIKLEFEGILLDLVYARLAFYDGEPSSHLENHKVAFYMDKASLECMNLFRTVKTVLDMVPNKNIFRITLHAIRLWAKKHLLFSHALGFFGTTSLAILVAHIQRRDRNASALKLVEKFFTHYSEWSFPSPIMLKTHHICRYRIPAWNSELHAEDKEDVMPILSPIYPEHNTSKSISKASCCMIQQQLSSDEILARSISNGKDDWNRLFDTVHFFEDHQNFLMVHTMAEYDDLYLNLTDLVEVKLPMLLQSLQNDSRLSVVRLNPQKYNFIADNTDEIPKMMKSSYNSVWMIALQFVTPETCDLSEITQSFIDSILPLPERDELLECGTQLILRSLISKDLLNFLGHDVLYAHMAIKEEL